MNRYDDGTGFTLIELLVAMAILGILMTAVTATFLAQSRSHAREEQSVAMEENLRVAVDSLTYGVRSVGYGVPSSGALADWAPWVAGFDANPKVTQGSGSNPDSISLAGCFEDPVAQLSSDYDPDPAADGEVVPAVAFTGNLDQVLDSYRRSLIMIGDGEYARVSAVAPGTIVVDSNPSAGAPGDQPLSRVFPAGTPICRVDVLTYSIATDPATGAPRLLLDRNDGNGPHPAAEGVSDLQISATGVRRLRLQITARSERRSPVTGTFLTRVITTDVRLRNS